MGKKTNRCSTIVTLTINFQMLVNNHFAQEQIYTQTNAQRNTHKQYQIQYLQQNEKIPIPIKDQIDINSRLFLCEAGRLAS